MYGRVGRFVKIELYFDNKWLLVSEIKFKSKSTSKDVSHNVDLGEKIAVAEAEDKTDADNNSENVSNGGNSVGAPPSNDGSDKSAVAKSDSTGGDAVLSDTPHPPGSNSGLVNNGDEPKSPTSTENNQIYIGLVIGVLGVTVILLLVTIVVMMRRNKQKIFNKHSMFKSPLSDRHMMRDLTPLNSCPSGSAGPSSGRKLGDESEHEESNSIYHEPYR